MKTFYRYHNDTFCAEVLLFVNMPQEDAEVILRKRYGLKERFEVAATFAGRAFSFVNTKNETHIYVIFIADFNFLVYDYDTLSHESGHIADYILRNAEMSLGAPDMNHVGLYLQGAIFRFFLRKLTIEAKKQEKNT